MPTNNYTWLVSRVYDSKWGNFTLAALLKTSPTTMTANLYVLAQMCSFVAAFSFYWFLSFTQFTLCYILKGNKPDFHQAMGAEQSKMMYDSFLDQMKAAYNADCIKGR